MISVVDRYFSLNRILLLIVGLWPYQRSIFSRLQSICCFGTVGTFVIFQFTTFMTTKCTTDRIIKIFSFSFTIICVLIKYNSFYVNNDAIKCLLEQLQRVYNDIKDTNEIAIIHKYGDIAKLYTTAMTMVTVCWVFLFVGSHLLPYSINIISSSNESQPHRLLIPTEYFIDQEKYYYVALLHLNATGFISIVATTATGTMLIAFFQHACGLFKVASYRITNTMEIYIQSLKLKNENLVYNNLIHGIIIHRKAIMISEYLMFKLEISFMFLIAFGVMSLSLNTFRILSFEYSIEEFPFTFVLTSGCFIYMFLANLIGQEIIDHYELIFSTAYETQWYMTPLYIQKLIIFLLLRGNKSFGLNVGGLFISSLQCFATLANASLSYVILMYSMQQ